MSASRKKFGYYPAPGSAGAPRMERLMADNGTPLFLFPDLSAEEEAVYKKTQIYINWETMMLHSMKDAKVGETPKKVLPKENRKRKQYEQDQKVQRELERKKRMEEFDSEKRDWLAKLKANKRGNRRGRRKAEVFYVEEEDEEEDEEVYKPYVRELISPASSSKATSPPAPSEAVTSPPGTSGLTSPAASSKATSPAPATKGKIINRMLISHK